MAIGCHCVNRCQALHVVCLILLCWLGPVANEEQEASKEAPQSSGFVHFNNPKLLQSISSDADSSYLYDGQQEALDARMIGGMDILKESVKLGSNLQELSNEMAVQRMQGIYDAIPFEEVDSKKLDRALHKLAEDIKSKFDSYLTMLKTNKVMVENLYQHYGNQHILTQPRDCCTLTNHELRFHEEYKGYVSQQLSCDMLSPSSSFATLTAFNPGRNLTEVFQHTIQIIPSIKWQFFISISGVHNEYPAHNFNNMPYLGCKNMHDYRHREEYVWNVQPKQKRVLILLDHGNSLSANQLSIAKAIAKYILLSLSNQDRVSIIGLSGETGFMRDDTCIPHHLVPLTDKARSQFITFIDSLNKMETATNHSLGFETAFSIIENSMAMDTLDSMPGKEIEPVLITYISRGLLSALTDAKDVLKVISERNANLQNKIVINTYAVIDDGKPIMYEKKFLQNIASQNFQQYLLTPRAPGLTKPGIMRSVNTTNDLSEVVGDFYTVFNYTALNQPHIFLPKKDAADEGLVITMTWPCFHEKKFIGVVGFDIRAGDVLEPVTYFTHTDRNTYAFLIDKHGNTIMHPNMKRPILAKDQPMFTDISHYEDYREFDNARKMMLEHDEGVQRIEILRYKNDQQNRMSQNALLPALITIRYAWRRVYLDRMNDEAPFIAVVRSIEDVFKIRDMEEGHVLDQPSVVYHRLDLLPTDNTCMHLKQLSTLDTSSLFLSASCFLTPYIHISEEETKRSVKGYLAYLKDKTNLISNPGIKDNIRKEVSTISQINGEWLKMFKASQINENIVRRYVATTGGAMLMFPGTLISKMYDATNREWFRRALESPGKVTLTAPYLDVGGAGYIVTISHTVYEGKDTFHGPMDRIVAVMGLDLTLGYFYKILLEQMPICDKPHMRCFIMDDRGYLIAHEGLIEPNGRSPVEQQHITHIEPLVANDILNHRHFVKKSLCNSFSDRTIQRFYHFNTSVGGALTNLVHGEHCEKYVLTGIPGTNTFLGIVNKTCNMMRAFCPCSMVDRLCLNCKRMEQTECECPCECPLDMNYCSGELLQAEDRNPSCPRPQEDMYVASISAEVSTRLPQCFHNKCSHRKNRRDCLGVVDCEWCVMDKDGTTRLKESFCSTQRVCFAGVLGATTPYHDHIKEMLIGEESVSVKSTPVGPVAGGIMGSFLLLAFMVYCYRQHRHRHSQAYMSSLADNQTRMSQLDHEFEEIDHSDDVQAGHTNIVLATFENPASMSPYRVSTNYRRPTGGDSDHGYSTMTPQEDSEQASTACLEPLIIGRDRYRPSSSNISKLSSGGMLPPPPPNHRQSLSPSPTANTQTQLAEPTTQLPPQTTVIASPHHIMAPVTVHMVDSH